MPVNSPFPERCPYCHAAVRGFQPTQYWKTYRYTFACGTVADFEDFYPYRAHIWIEKTACYLSALNTKPNEKDRIPQ